MIKQNYYVVFGGDLASQSLAQQVFAFFKCFVITVLYLKKAKHDSINNRSRRHDLIFKPRHIYYD
ncbi:hypothetical protein H8356DRAFT_1330517 [Neocallimastix lanati (nom. inval.)]|nr:hypothetical protein H8356DRAFT_1330517 [Neocallimastix sp. JGI-2020a]